MSNAQQGQAPGALGWLLDRWVTIALGAIALALLIAMVTDAALTWDGAYYLFRTLDDGVPFVAHDRLFDATLQWPVLWMAAITDNLTALRLVFGLIQVSTPLVVLTACWWIVRREAPQLLVWPFLGIGIVTLPGQIDFISGSLRATQLAWPVLLAVLVGMPPSTIALVGLLILTMTFTHPVAVPLLASTALAAVVIAWLRPDIRGRMVPSAVALGATSLLRYSMILPGYDSEAMTWDAQRFQWEYAVAGLPAMALSGAAVAAVALLLPGKFARLRFAGALIGMAIAGAALLRWGIEPGKWRTALDYRGPAVILTMVTMGLAFLDAVIRLRRPPKSAESRPLFLRYTRQGVSLAAAATFSLVIAAQSYGWHASVERMREAIDRSESACVSTDEIQGFHGGALDNWSTASLSLLYDDFSPERIVLPPEACAEGNVSGRIGLTAWHPDYVGNHYELQPLREAMMRATGCRVTFDEGWDAREQYLDERWYWSSGTGVVTISLEEASTVLLSMRLETLVPSNIVTIEQDGARVEEIAIVPGSPHTITDLALDLPAGQSTLTFSSPEEPVRPDNDPRDLNFSVWNLRIQPTDGSTPCAITDAAR